MNEPIAVGGDPATDGFRFTMTGGVGQPELPSHIYVRWAEGPKKKGEPFWTPVPVEPYPQPIGLPRLVPQALAAISTGPV